MSDFSVEKIENRKEIVITSVFIVACLVLSTVFPSRNSVENILKSVFFLVLVPVFYIKTILRRRINEFGLNLRNAKKGLLWGGMMLAVSLLAGYFLSNTSAFRSNYHMSSLVIESFGYFLISVLFFSGLALFVQEYFFRGFILSFYRKDFSVWATIIQLGAYLLAASILEISSGGNLWQITPFMILAATGTITAYKSRSMLYSWASGMIFLFMFNAYLIYTIK